MRGILAILTLLVACTSDPKLPKEKMIDILTDMHIADQAVREYDLQDRDSISIALMQSLLKVHSVTQAQLDTNLYLYQIDLPQYKIMMDTVMKRIQRLSENTTLRLRELSEDDQ